MPKAIAMVLEGSASGKISDGASSGDSIGGLARSGEKADTCYVVAFQDEMVRPTDPQTGQPTGNRIHRGVKITKILDKASPILRQAMTPANAETFTVTLKFYRSQEGSGVEEHYYTITLEEAVVVDIIGWTPNVLDKEKTDFVDMEDVTFTYKKAIYKHEIASAESEDDASAT